ncbi:hypothetical protein ANO11243_059180 [Dothideomycetidae sp. 11243]|nr:hypothetical protein ANO11243_059180 [fungal sp. No.11243]
MNRSNGFPPGASASAGAPAPPSSRPPIDGTTRPPLSSGSGSNSNQSRAQRFESEKQRIQESCFSKVDEQGQQAESYITHLRIEEDGAYPTVPPPPEASVENKKARVIMVAVKSTGRVRVHKARENHNGSFSIGKTWNLEDLSAVESFNYIAPDASPLRRTHCQRAGALGFTVTIGKPYYWQAGTSKERDFFIASLVKIYRKYTKGRTPELIGFDDAERDQMFGPMGPAGPPGGQAQQQSQQQQQQQPRPSYGGMSPSAMQQAFSQPSRPTSRDTDPRNMSVSTDRFTPSTQSSTSPGGPPSARRFMPPQSPPLRSLDSSQGAYNQSRQPSQDPRIPPEQGLGIRNYPSPDRLRAPSTDGMQGNERMRRPSREAMSGPDRFRQPGTEGQQAPAMRSPDSSRNGHLNPQRPGVDLQPPRGPSPVGAQLSAPPRGQGPPGRQPKAPVLYRGMSDDGRANSAAKDRLAPPNLPQSGSSMPDLNGRPIKSSGSDRNNSVDSRDSPSEHGSLPDQTNLPERRRPPLTGRILNPAPSYENDELKPPPLSTNRSPSSTSPTSPKLPGTFVETPTPSPLPTSQSPYKKPLEPTKPVAEATKSPTEATSLPATVATPDVQTPDGEKTEEEAARPGLGPMFKKRDVANAFRRAATAANAFKPRAGGAGDRFKKQAETPTDQDGVHGVVPAPLRGLDASRNNSIVSTPQSERDSPQLVRQGSIAPSEVQTASPTTINSEPVKIEVPLQTSASKATLDGLGISERQDGRPVVKPKRRNALQDKYLASLGFDPVVFENKGLEFELILSEAGWGSEILQPNRLDQMESDIKREIGRVEAGSWLQHVEQKDERVGLVDRMLDRAIAECDELDGLLTLYSVELSTLNEDISFIEAQSQGLQVQTANQKILQTELQNLINTISITPDQLAALEQGSFDEDLDAIESNLVILYQAMLTIDPTIKTTGSLLDGQVQTNDNSERSELANMHALQEKRDIYLEESDRFCQRLVNRVGSAFDMALHQAIPTLMKPAAGQKGAPWKLYPAACNASRAGLWQYSPLVLYTKEVNQRAWRHLLNTYTDIARPLYQTVFRTALDSHKKNVRPPTGDEADVLFTGQEKESSEGLGVATRKLTMKRSQTLAKATRQASGEKARLLQSGRQLPYEAFAELLAEWAPTLAMEQNYVVDLFHASSLENMDFIDAVQSQTPEQRRGPPDLLMPRIAEPDRNLSDHVQRAMQTIFEFWQPELLKMVEQSTINDPIQSVGMLAAIAIYSAPLHETSQDYLLRSLTDTSTKLETVFSKFIDAQVLAIEDTKVLLKKRKGVISIIRTFPHFSTAVENVFAGASRGAGNSPVVSDVRRLIDDAYERINQSMWVALKQIAKDSPSGGAVQGGAASQGTEAEDKEILNYHILLIENMNHYIEEVDDGGNEESVLASWKIKAVAERNEHLDQYVQRVVRRPLGKLLDFVESTESLLAQNPNNPSSIASKPSHSRSAAKRSLSPYDSREIRKGIEALRKRVEKHFDPSSSLPSFSSGQQENPDDRAMAQKLVPLVLEACEACYLQILERTNKIASDVYSGGEKGIDVEWTKDDVLVGFRR